CTGWSSSSAGVMGIAGNPTTVTTSWLNNAAPNCDTSHGLYCLEVGAGAGPNTLPSLPGGAKLAFLAYGPYLGDFATGTAPDGGPDAVHVAADSLCAQAAAAAALPGTFHAWVSSTGTGAQQYFASLAMQGPWYRADGFQIAPNLASLTNGSGISTQ